jgi:RNA polymerase sigma factor (sigma-70 family)
VNQRDWLGKRFEENRSHLRAVAYRMLGSPSEADDAVQESWLRLSRADTSNVDNLRGWLTTVVARVCLDMLRSRESRHEESLEANVGEANGDEADGDPEREMMLADSVGLAMLVVLDHLVPAERVAFVLHDMFDLPFEEIAPIVGRSAMAARQLASRARRRVRGVTTTSGADRARQQEIVSAFRAASRSGNLEALLALLDPDIVVRADRAAVKLGAHLPLPAEVRGAESVANLFARQARGARPATINGAPGLVWAPGGETRVAFDFTITNGKVASIVLIADPGRLAELEVVVEAE